MSSSNSSLHQPANLWDRIFRLGENKTNVKTEILAGFTTFVTMSYILFVNPSILKDAGMPMQATFAATAIGAAFATLLMGFLANYPIALAPGMGLNAFFTYSVVIGMHLPWQTALGAVFISGLVFFILTVTKVREWIIRGVPEVLKLSISVGIGLFITVIGLENGGLITKNADTLIQLGNMRSPSVLIAIVGLILTAWLLSRNIKGSFLIGIIATTVIAMITGVSPAPKNFSVLTPVNPFSALQPTFMHLSIGDALNAGLITILFAFTFVDMFDNIGTLIGVTRKAGLLDEQGNLPRMGRALLVDSIATMFGSVMGTPTVTSYIESTSGVAEGGKTGLTSVVVGLLFLVAIIFSPIVGLIPSQATAPVLILVGLLMMGDVVKINFQDFTEAFPAFLTIIMMPFTYSIAQGLAFGFMGYTVIKLISGRHKENNAVTYVLTVLFILHFILG